MSVNAPSEQMIGRVLDACRTLHDAGHNCWSSGDLLSFGLAVTSTIGALNALVERDVLRRVGRSSGMVYLPGVWWPLEWTRNG